MQNNELKTVAECTDLAGTYVFLRTSIDVPIEQNEIQNEFRLMRGLPTIQYLVDQGARVILGGHMGSDGTQSTKPIADFLSAHVPTIHSTEVAGSVSMNLRDQLENGQVLVLENLRKDPREKKNDAEFARALADLATVYVNDDFATAHRAHASVSAITTFLPSYVGINFAHEYNELTKARTPEHPAIFILGGAKFDTKLPLIETFLDIYDHIFIGGALANDLLKAKGYEVGRSLVSDIDLTDSPLLTNPKLLIPTDVTVERGGVPVVVLADAVEPDDCIMDVGPASAAMVGEFIDNAATILWNGPLGNYEAGYDVQTRATAIRITDSNGYSVVGGGDTIAAIESLGRASDFGFLSTAGGAMLTFLETGTLPAVEAVRQASNYQ